MVSPKKTRPMQFCRPRCREFMVSPICTCFCSETQNTICQSSTSQESGFGGEGFAVEARLLPDLLAHNQLKLAAQFPVWIMTSTGHLDRMAAAAADQN